MIYTVAPMAGEQQQEPSIALDMLRRPGLFFLSGLIVVTGVSIDVLTSEDNGPAFGSLVEAYVPQLKD